MDLKRFFTEERIVGDIAYLKGDEFIHAVKVTRHKVGYKLILCDDSGYDFYSTVEEIGADYLKAKVDNRVFSSVMPKKPIRLFIGLNKDIDSVIRKAVEMGVEEVVLFFSQHCNEKKFDIKRAERIVLESCKQCGRAIRMKVGDSVSYDTVLSALDDESNNILFYEFEREHRVRDLIDIDKKTNIIIGCEGGFSVEEREKFKYSVATLGKTILRVGTAVVSALTLVLSAYGEI